MAPNADRSKRIGRAAYTVPTRACPSCFDRMSNNRKTVAVVVPMSNRPQLTPEEEISFRHLNHYLGRYDKYLVVPKSLRLNFPGFALKPFDEKYFGSVQA